MEKQGSVHSESFGINAKSFEIESLSQPPEAVNKAQHTQLYCTNKSASMKTKYNRTISNTSTSIRVSRNILDVDAA